MYPLRFEPTFREYLWGGRKLGTVLGKPIGDGPCYAESWEIVDHGEDQSVVANGDLRGKTLRQLVQEMPNALLGSSVSGQFPLLLKFLDAQKHLSVQVHPNDEQARKQTPRDLGKTEAWVVMQAEPDAKIYAGLRDEIDPQTMQKHIDQGTTEDCLHVVIPKPGDCLFLQAGAVHAIGAGCLIAEIQQASDTTFRIFDWNRVDKDGKPRQLHIEQAMNVIDFSRGPIEPQVPQALGPNHEELVRCDKFCIERRNFNSEAAGELAGDGRFHIIAVLRGSVKLLAEPSQAPFEMGQTTLIPASVQNRAFEAEADTIILDMYIP